MEERNIHIIRCHSSSHCKICYGEKAETVKLWLVNCRKKDRNNDLLNENFVDKNFLIKLVIDSYDLCYYCSKPLQFLKKNYTIATLDRIDDNIGHEKGNVVISCLYCNLAKPRINGRIENQHRHKYYKLYSFLKDNFNIE